MTRYVFVTRGHRPNSLELMPRYRLRSLKGSAIGKKAFRRRRDLGRRLAMGVRRRAMGRSRGYTRTSGFYGRYAGPSAELKFHDVDLDDAVIAAGGAITSSINLIAQGTTESTRIGRRCTLRSINWRFEVTFPAGTTTATSDIVRVIMYLDKQANGATAAVTDILESADFQSFNNLANKSRFRTLMDRTYDMEAGISGDGTTIDTGTATTSDSFFKNVALPLEFDSTAGALTEIRSNNIGVLLLSRSGIAGFTSKIRLRFSDSG